jgi:hypothetical protein
MRRYCYYINGEWNPMLQSGWYWAPNLMTLKRWSYPRCVFSRARARVCAFLLNLFGVKGELS